MDENELERRLDRAMAETRRHFDVVAERTDQKLEAITEALGSLGEVLRGRIDTVEEKMDRGFAETQAMIRFLTPSSIAGYALWNRPSAICSRVSNASSRRPTERPSCR